MPGNYPKGSEHRQKCRGVMTHGFQFMGQEKLAASQQFPQTLAAALSARCWQRETDSQASLPE